MIDECTVLSFITNDHLNVCNIEATVEVLMYRLTALTLSQNGEFTDDVNIALFNTFKKIRCE